MSLAFSDTTNKDGIIQIIEQACGFNDGDISGNAERLALFTARVNNAQGKVMDVIFNSDGSFQWDDSNHTDYPILTANIVSGQRDYSFTEDDDGNQIITIHKVMIADESGTFHDIYPIDQQQAPVNGLTDGLNTQGLPYRYDKTGNGIFLDPIPNYNEVGGIKIFVDREATFFTTADTTKKPGFAGIYHEYLPLQAAYTYARDNMLANRNELLRDAEMMLENLRKHYSRREKDVEKIIRPRLNNII